MPTMSMSAPKGEPDIPDQGSYVRYFLVPREGLTRSLNNFADEGSTVIWAFDPKRAFARSWIG
jgi:hypothetical protein